MTRGNFVLLINDTKGNRHFYNSVKFNGNMYIKDITGHEGYGTEILRTYTSDKIHSLNDWIDYIEKFDNEHFNYDYENLCYEITKESCQKCTHENEFNCITCDKRYICNINYNLSGVENIYDITSWNYHFNYTYVLNLTDDDIEFKASNGIVRVNAGGGAVFNYDSFLSTEWDSGIISAEDSYDFPEEAKILKLMNEWNMDEDEAIGWNNFCSKYNKEANIVTIYDDYYDLGCYKSKGLPEWADDYFDYDAYGKSMFYINDDNFYYELNSGRIVEYELN